MSDRHKFQWTGQWENGKEIDLTKIPCASAFGISDCWPCCILPDLKMDLINALELALTGRIEVTVSSSYYYVPFHSLDPKHVHVDWFQDLTNPTVCDTVKG